MVPGTYRKTLTSFRGGNSCGTWDMEFNSGKCVVMHITRARPQELVFMIKSLKSQ